MDRPHRCFLAITIAIGFLYGVAATAGAQDICGSRLLNVMQGSHGARGPGKHNGGCQYEIVMKDGGSDREFTMEFELTKVSGGDYFLRRLDCKDPQVRLNNKGKGTYKGGGYTLTFAVPEENASTAAVERRPQAQTEEKKSQPANMEEPTADRKKTPATQSNTDAKHASKQKPIGESGGTTVELTEEENYRPLHPKGTMLCGCLEYIDEGPTGYGRYRGTERGLVDLIYPDGASETQRVARDTMYDLQKGQHYECTTPFPCGGIF